MVVNKCESEGRRDAAGQFYELGLGDPIAVSAIHGTGTGDLLDILVSAFPEEEAEEEDENIKIALVGKPNAGKSSLLNQLLGHDRAIVSAIPGTTRDSVDVPFEVETDGVRQSYVLIDTAGIRAKRKTEDVIEKFSVLKSLDSLKRCDLAILLIDGPDGLSHQDRQILQRNDVRRRDGRRTARASGSRRSRLGRTEVAMARQAC